jgi:hypothetical protein
MIGDRTVLPQMTPGYFPASLQNIFAIFLHHHRLPVINRCSKPQKVKGAQEE